MTVTLLFREGAVLPVCTAVVQVRSAGPDASWRAGGMTFRGEETIMPNKVEKTAGSAAARRQPARRRVVARLWLAAERQVAEIETRLIAGGDPATLERDAKTFALLARTVRDLVALDLEAEAQSKEKRRPHASKDDTGAQTEQAEGESFASRDIEDFRAELARRLAALRAEGTTESSA